ncbi:carbohydrate-binding family 9-like protein [Verrucomicrobiota bacterium]
MQGTMEYMIRKATERPSLKGQWDEPAWQRAQVVTLDCFLKESSEHHPRVEARVTYWEDSLFVLFRVFDKYVRSTRTDYQSRVCEDSCVEFFVRPCPEKGYFTFEINCGGAMLLYYIEDATRLDNGFAEYSQVPRKLADQIDIYHSLPDIVDPEKEDDLEWTVEYSVPFRFFESYVGRIRDVSGRTWHGNFYKCASDSSHPHWASWAPLRGEFNFHVPDCFAPLRFE